MPFRAHVQTDLSRFDGLAVYLAREGEGERFALGQPTEVVFSETDPHVQQEPTFRMPEAVARALLDALAAHFGGTSDVQTLRKDYLAERARVDKLIGHLTGPSS